MSSYAAPMAPPTKRKHSCMRSLGNWATVFEKGKIRYRPDGKPEKTKLQMDKGHFQGKDQDFYDNNGIFKGMTQILEECGLTKEARLRANCKGGCLPNTMSAANAESSTTSPISLIKNLPWRSYHAKPIISKFSSFRNSTAS
jgi:hypothetical protein